MRIGKFDLKFDQKSLNIQKCLDIWKDVNCMKLLTRININCGVSNFEEKDRAKCRVMKHNCHNYVLMFHSLMVFKHEEKENIVHVIHKKIGHLNEQQTLAEVNKRYF